VNRGKSISDLAANLQDSHRTIEVIEASENHLKNRIEESMTTYTRNGEPLAFEETKMSYYLLIRLSADSIDIIITVVDFTLFDYYNGFSKKSIESTKKYFPNEMFLKTNYYDGRKPKKKNVTYKDDVIRIVQGVYKGLN
jgi:hypothetical protein